MDRIPKILHLYWDGGPMSWLQTITVFSFHRYNPDWIINVYIPKSPFFGGSPDLSYLLSYEGKDYFYLIEQSGIANIIKVDFSTYGINQGLHNILKSDILRYHLLYDYGGVWSDFDVIWLRPMSHFYNLSYYGNTPIKDVNTVVSFIHGTHGGHSIGVMIDCKNDPYMLDLISLCSQMQPPYKHETFGSSMISAKYPSLESMSCFENVIGVKFETYYPYNIHPPNPTINKLYGENDLCCITDNVMCLHWYNGHVLSKQFVNDKGITGICSMEALLAREKYGYKENGTFKRYYDNHLLYVVGKPQEVAAEPIEDPLTLVDILTSDQEGVEESMYGTSNIIGINTEVVDDKLELNWFQRFWSTIKNSFVK